MKDDIYEDMAQYALTINKQGHCRLDVELMNSVRYCDRCGGTGRVYTVSVSVYPEFYRSAFDYSPKCKSCRLVIKCAGKNKLKYQSLYRRSVCQVCGKEWLS